MCFKELFPGVFEHEQLLVRHKEACVMGWRRRSGNPIALRAEEERRQTSAAGLAPRRGPGSDVHKGSQAIGNPRFYGCDTRSDMSNDPVSCEECNCVVVVKDVTDEGFFSCPCLLKIAAEQQFCPWDTNCLLLSCSVSINKSRYRKIHPASDGPLLDFCCLCLVWVDILNWFEGNSLHPDQKKGRERRRSRGRPLWLEPEATPNG